MRSRGDTTHTYQSNDSTIYLFAYNIFLLEMTDGGLYDCHYADSAFGCCYDKLNYGEQAARSYRVTLWRMNDTPLNMLEKSRANKMFDTKNYKEYRYIKDEINKKDIRWANPESMDCVSFFHAYPEGKLIPTPFPEPLIKIKKFSYKDFSNKYIIKNPSKQLYPALEALFTGKPMTEVDSLLKVGYGELNQDTWELKGNDGQ